MKARKIVLQLMFAALFSSFVLLQCAGAQMSKPLSQDDVIQLLEGKVSAERVEELAREKGISFTLTPKTETALRNAGATSALLSTLRGLAPKPAPTAPVSQPNPPNAGGSSVATEAPLPAGMDPKLADLYHRAQAGNPQAMSELGRNYLLGRGLRIDYQQALAWLRKAADAGEPRAINGVGAMYLNGWGVEKDYQQALSWFRKAAAAGEARAMNNLGIMYEQGYGVERDYQQAVSWYRRAAEVGDDVAMNNLGVMYQNGYGVKQDDKQAASWFRKAAEAGNVDAMESLCKTQKYGLEVDMGLKETIDWCNKAAKAIIDSMQ